MKVLMSAYSCEPGRGSEPGVGWNVVREMANHHDVWVLTRPDESKDVIEAELQENPIPNLHFIYFNWPLIGGLWKLNESGAMQLHYYLWQIQAYFIARQWHQKIGFDVAQHVTFVKYSSPCFLAFLPIPLVWGPVGGGESAPGAFWKDFNWKNKAYEWLRGTWRGIGELDPFARLTAQRSTVAYATTEDTARRVRAMGGDHVQCLSESGLSQADIEQLAQCPPPDTNPVRFISIARLLHWKGFHLGLQAFAAADLPEAEYWILGDGPEHERLETLANELGVGHQVKLFGRVPRAQVLEKLSACSVLVHPSLHDSGGWVCLEAMAAGRPVICLDLGGPAQQVIDTAGVKAPVDSPEIAVRAMADAMKALADDPQRRVKMGKAGQRHIAQSHTWQAKGKLLSSVYESIRPATSVSEAPSCVS